MKTAGMTGSGPHVQFATDWAKALSEFEEEKKKKEKE